MKTCNQERSASEKGIQKMGLTRSSPVTRELVQPSKIATEMEAYMTAIVKMTGDAVWAPCLFRYYGQDAQMLQGRLTANPMGRNVSGKVAGILR